MILRKMRIGARLTVGFGSILAIMLVVVVASTALSNRSRVGLVAALEAASAKQMLAAEMTTLEAHDEPIAVPE